MSNDNIDAIFDLAAEPTPSVPDNTESTTPESTPATNAAPTSDAETSSEASGGALYPNVFKVLTQSEAGDGNPEGTLTIGEFAGYLTVEAIKAGGGISDIVKDANVYTATKAKRAPLPVVLVFADDADKSDLSNAKVYLPVAEATEAWRNRPARGEGNGTASSKRDKDTLLTGLAKKTVELAKIKERLDRTTAQFEKGSKTVEKYHGWLSEHFRNESDPDAALKEALEARIDELAAEEDAAKNADIPDNNDTDEAQNA